MPALGRALLAGSMLDGVIVAVLWPMLRSGPALDAEFLQLVVARFRFPWYFIPSCLNPTEVARFVLLELMGLLALRLAGLRRSHWSVAVVLSALALIGLGAAGGGALWHLPWLELTMGVILAALAEGVDLRVRRGADPEAWTERGAKVTAVVREDPTPLPWPILHREGDSRSTPSRAPERRRALRVVARRAAPALLAPPRRARLRPGPLTTLG
jgi:hypothetical protein